MKKYFGEFAFAENFCSVEEWDAGMMSDGFIEAESAEEAAKQMSYTDGLENALFRVYELSMNEFGEMEKCGDPEYFVFR